ncbi:MAG: cytochrome c oxidase subunit II, partial [Chloroflexota bacterium]|nr:cytochrome c oxidase subunit II [Chloroflexota bacterium]
MLAITLVAGLFVLPQLASAADPYSSVSPRSDEARDIQFLYKIIFWLALVVFIGVQAAIVWTVLRYRRRSENEARPEQIHGNQKLEVLWTIIPALVLVAIFIPTVRTMFAIDDRTNETEMTIQVYGKQWWWEVHYTEPETVANVVTANDIYIPVGKRVRFELLTSNVIHSFWVPQLAGKLDLIPGHTNVLSIKADTPGMYYGECAEFCGESHAYMRFKVIAVPEDQFAVWLDGMQTGASSAAASLAPEGDVDRVPQSMALCIACHRIGGVPNGANGQPLGTPPMGIEGGNSPDNQILGPNLAMVACRTSLAAGIIPNDEESMRDWLHNPGGVKQGNFMATMIEEGTLTDEQITDIVAYLKTLQPEGGCPVITGEN